MKYSYIILVHFLFYLLFSCKPEKCYNYTDPSCENYNPCAGVKRTDASFLVEEEVGGYWDTIKPVYTSKRFRTDTVSVINDVFFTSIHTLDSYDWTIGNDPRKYTTKSSSIFFDEGFESIGVTLRGFKASKALCLSAEKAWDTSLTFIHVIGRDRFDLPIKPAYSGTFYGKFNLGDSSYFDLTIKPDSVKKGGINEYYYSISGSGIALREGVCTPKYERVFFSSYGYKSFSDDPLRKCNLHLFNGEIYGNNLKIIFREITSYNPYSERYIVFVGVRK